ncbi:ATP-binding protein [Marinimicrobium sp. ARAG 43.8]|uniref:ATP-binding protein n=1 Tax=Marinimicrobium sp. ARAG 43.8 TaxID=3418719 RepID=UPI003CE82912
MYLKRSITVNWGNLPAGELEYGPVNLFSGGNGSGKTTAADALQTLMTAAHDNLFTYNPGQDETTQRGRGGKQVRTLASYVLGCDDGAFARPYNSDGYIAGIFHPTKGETAEPFTAVIGVRAHLDNAGSSAQARQNELLLMIVPGEMLSLSHFVREYPDGKHAVPVTELASLLRQQFGKKAVETYDKKGAYLARLYGALRGKRDAVSQNEARNAARTFARFMAYKPVESISQFVASEVLEPHDMGDTLRRIRDLMRTVHGMAEEAEQLRQNVNLLGQSKSQTEHYLETWLELTTQAYGAAVQQFQRNQKQYLDKKEEQNTLRQQQEGNREEAEQVQQRLDQAYNERVELEARILGIPALRDKQQLESQRDQLTQQLQDGARPLLEQDQQRDANLEALRNIQSLLARHSIELELPELASKHWRATSKALLSERHTALPDLNQMLGRDWIDLSPLEEGLTRVRSEQQLHNQLAEQLHSERPDQTGQEASSITQRLDRLVSKRGQALDSLDQQQQKIEQQIRNLESKRVNYPQDVDVALQAIRQECPQAEPRVLCDHVEVQDEKWAMSIEGYIGGARFGILVEPEYEAEAIRIVRRLAGKQRNRARVIQGEQARRDAEKISLPDNSLFHALRFSHRTAEHYLKASYGNVVRVNDAETLRTTRRGITVDGLGSGNYALFRCDLPDSDLVFGEAARERNLLAQRNALTELQENYQNAADIYQAVKQLHNQIKTFQPLDWVSAATHLLNAQRQLEETEKALANLDLSDHQELEKKQQKAKALHQDLEARQKTLTEAHGKLSEKLSACTSAITKLADQSEHFQESQDEAEANLHACIKYWPGLNVKPRIEAMDERLNNAQGDIDFVEESKTLTNQLHQATADVIRTLDRYNQQAQPADQIMTDSAEEPHSAPFFGHIHNLNQQLDKLHNRLSNNVLLEKQEKLASLRDTFNTTFVSDLCSQIHQAIKDGERILKSLNDELEHHQFGADRERFEFKWEWIPEYKEYWSFFKEVIDIPNLGDGTSLFDTPLSAKAEAVRDRLLKLLLDGDEQQALRELERISDYRRYRQYDILKHPEGKQPISLSQYGTGSGGQLETPAYIIRAAAITSAFRFNEGDSHLRMVIVDEAFMHMDESRSKSVINYLTNTLGLQLIFIMPTSKAGPFLDLISNQFVFSKVPSPVPVGELNTRVLVDRQQLNRERIGELWEQHRRVIRQQGALDFMEDVQ